MSAKGKSRRSFLINSVGGVNAAWVAAHYHDILAAQEYASKGSQPPKLAVFTDAQAAEIEAMADQIIPTDSSPGAREARCLYFIDRALSTFDKAKQPAYVQGLQDLQAKTQQLYPDSAKFSALSSAQQIKVLTEIEKTPFFNTVRTHTIIGFLSRPVHGGNYDRAGWQLIGYDDSLNHKPPVRLLRWRGPNYPVRRRRKAMKQYKTSTEVDFVVIGSGAAGGIMAKQLSTAGFSVVVLEQGSWGKYGREQEYNKDEWLNRNLSDDDRLMSDPSRQRNTFRRNDQAKAGPGTHSYGCVVGGGTVTYGGSSWRHLPYEFKEASYDQTIPSGTGMADWPITYEELEPYYTQAEWEMGISGLRVDSPFLAPMTKDYPVPPMPLKSSGALMKTAASKLGLTVVPGPLAIISQNYMGRQGCVNCGICSGYGCQVRARSSSAVTMLPIAEKTGRCEIRVKSYVREISVDNSGRVTGVVYFDAQKRENRQKAKAVILSANGSESPRLLLMSKSARFPDGLANSSGVVGKYVMFGNGAVANALFEHPLNEYKGVISGAGIVDYVPSDSKRGFYGGGRMTARGYLTPLELGLGGLSPEAPRWGSRLADRARAGSGGGPVAEISTS